MRFYGFFRMGWGILEEAFEPLKGRFGGRAVVITGREFSRGYGERIARVLNCRVYTAFEVPESVSADLVIGVGGGSVIDRAKLLAYERSIPFVSVPTLPSSDGIASPVSVVNGKSLFLTLPYGLVVDLDVISSSPEWGILAGVGDAISNLSASYDWDRFKNLSEEPYVSEASAMAKTGAMGVMGIHPKRDTEVLVWGLILSGMAMEMAGSSRPASGPEHKISHALDAIGYGEKHGVQVGIFTPLFLKLNGWERWEEVRNYLLKVGFPPSVKLSERDARTVFSTASSTRPHRYTVLEHMGWEKVLKEALELGFVEIF